MKYLVLLFVACLSLASSFIINDPLVHDWESFKTTHGKNYDGEEEEKLRFGIWKSNLKFVEQHNVEANQGKHTFWVAINKFADLVRFSLFKIIIMLLTIFNFCRHLQNSVKSTMVTEWTCTTINQK
jgi:cathepsin L